MPDLTAALPRPDAPVAFSRVHESPINTRRAIHAWPEDERPREKLRAHGAAALSDAELLALVFGSGTVTKAGPVSALGLGQGLIGAFASLLGLARRDPAEMTTVVGIGPAKAAQIAAVFEIGRRVEAQRESGKRITVTGPADVAAHYGPQLRDLPVEVFVVVTLSTAGVITGDARLTTGGLAASIVEPRAVFRRAILDNAASVVVLHNHPSGNPEPSREDIRVTKQLVEAGKLMGIPVQDHLIIAGATFTSLAERGLM